eukprot:3330618-Rhodomonas_salina.1
MSSSRTRLGVGGVRGVGMLERRSWKSGLVQGGNCRDEFNTVPGDTYLISNGATRNVPGAKQAPVHFATRKAT